MRSLIDVQNTPDLYVLLTASPKVLDKRMTEKDLMYNEENSKSTRLAYESFMSAYGVTELIADEDIKSVDFFSHNIKMAYCLNETQSAKEENIEKIIRVIEKNT